MEALSTAVRAALSNVRGLASLRLQNHLYGCYLLLEDIVQKNMVVTGTVAKGPHVTLDLIKQFSEIGIRYGFAIDTQLLLTCSDEYRDAWIRVFTTFSTLEEVDALEENLNEVIRFVVPAEDAFFASTAETGSLPTQWVDRALSLLLTKDVEESAMVEANPATSSATSAATSSATSAATSSATSSATSAATSAAISAATSPPADPKPSEVKALDKPLVPAVLLEKHKDNPRRMFASTHRKKLVITKKLLAFTRRAKPHV